MSRERRTDISVPAASEAFFAALLSAASSNCDCKTCKILRKLAEELINKYSV